MPGLPQECDGFQPAEDLLHEFAFALADRVPRMPGGSPIKGTAPVRGVLGDMRGDAAGTEVGDEVADVVALVGPPRRPRSPATNHRSRGPAVRRAGTHGPSP